MPDVPSRLRLEDYYEQVSLSSPALSPDGKRVAYIVAGYRRSENERYQNLYLAFTDGSGAHRLTRTPTSESAPAFSRDGRYLAFLSTRTHEIEVAESRAALRSDKRKNETSEGEDKQKPKPQVWVLDLLVGGEPRQLTSRPEGVESFDWAPDGRRLVIAARDPLKPEAAYLESIRKDKGPFVIGRVQHKFDGMGYLDDVKTHLFLVDVEGRAEKALTSGPASETDPRWSPDGRWILFRSNRTGDPDNNYRFDLWLVSPESGEIQRLTAGDVSASAGAFSPDGKHVAFTTPVGRPENAYLLTRLAVIDVADGAPVADFSALGTGWSTVGGVVPDEVSENPVETGRVYPVATGRTPFRTLDDGLDRVVMGPLAWRDERTVVAGVTDRAQFRLVEASLDGTWRMTLPQDPLAVVFDHAAGPAGVVAVMDTPAGGQELVFVPDAGTPRTLTSHQAMVRSRPTASEERFTFSNPDGVEVEGLVVVPPGETLGARRLPLLVMIHGGPMAIDFPGFHFDEQLFATVGYLILMVNYRGSIGYGEDFTKVIQGGWGPREHADVMAGVDACIERGWADPDRLFVTGFSQGGIMTNWAVGHTDRFRAAVTEHGLWDYVAAYGTDDCHLWWQDDLGVPWQNPEGYRRMSPMSGADRIRTPLLVMAGQEDWRCPLSQAEELYLSLKKRGVPTELVIYQEEHHAITRPRRGIDRLIRILGWFSRHGGLPFTDDSAEGYPGPGDPVKEGTPA